MTGQELKKYNPNISYIRRFPNISEMHKLLEKNNNNKNISDDTLKKLKKIYINAKKLYLDNNILIQL